MAGQYDRLAEFVSESSVVQHSPEIGDGIEALDPALRAVTYQRTYNVIGSGNFVAALSQVDHLTRY